MYLYQKGNTGIIILIVLVVVIAAGIGGYFVLGKSSTVPGLSIPGIKPALNPNCELKDPELCKFMNNWQNQKDYSVTTTSNMGGQTIESIFEISGQDKSHIVSKMNGKENLNTITIGNTTYTLDYTDNKWAKYTYTPDKQQNTPEQNVKDQVTLDTKNTQPDKTVYKFIDKEACGDKTCFKYEIVDAATTDTKQFIYFDDQDYLMRKMRIEDKANGVSESVYTYTGVNISVPSPVKDGNATPAAGDINNPDVQNMMKQYQQQYQQQAPADQSAPADQAAPTQDPNAGY